MSDYYGHPGRSQTEQFEQEDLRAELEKAARPISEAVFALDKAADEWIAALRGFLVLVDLDDLSDDDCKALDDLFARVSYRMAQIWEEI